MKLPPGINHMNPEHIAKIRLVSQQIAATTCNTPKELVGWMGAMQSQDYQMARWALGIRLPGLTDGQLQTAIDDGEILRTHVLRPTWHFVSRDDIHWMLDLTAQRIMASMSSRNKQLELTGKLFKKTNALLRKALTGGNHLTRDELVLQLQKAKVPTDENRASHIFAQAELDGIICSGASRGKKQTYALLEERVPVKERFTRDEALVKLAKKYFSSHCPATLQDFAWWSGLSKTEAQKGLEFIKGDLVREIVGTEKYWLDNSFSDVNIEKRSAFLLPAFDEYIISYKDRTASLIAENLKRAISTNGIFRPVIVIDGKVTGLWKRTISNERVTVETNFFLPHNETRKALIKKAASNLGRFLNKEIVVVHAAG